MDGISHTQVYIKRCKEQSKFRLQSLHFFPSAVWNVVHRSIRNDSVCDCVWKSFRSGIALHCLIFVSFVFSLLCQNEKKNNNRNVATHTLHKWCKPYEKKNRYKKENIMKWNIWIDLRRIVLIIYWYILRNHIYQMSNYIILLQFDAFVSNTFQPFNMKWI